MGITSNRPGGTSGYITPSGQEILTNKDVDGGTASNTNRITVPKDTKANLDALTRKEGTVVYASDLDTLFADDGSALQPIGSGGAGKKNYIPNPSAATSASTAWTAANMTVTRDTSTAIPRETTTKTAFKLVSTAGSSTATFLSDAILLDDADLSKKLGIELAIAVADASNWTIDVLNSATAGGTYTRIPLPTDVSSVTYLPNTTGTFKSSVDMDASKPYIKFKITSVATAKTAYFSDIIVTPDSNTVTGAVVGDWQAFPSNPFVAVTLGTGGTYYANYRRVGSNMEISAGFTLGTSGVLTGTLKVTLPNSLTINAALISAAQYALGSAFCFDTGGTPNRYIASPAYSSSTTIEFEPTGTTADVRATSPFTWAATDFFATTISVPIAEWAGSGTVNLAQNDVEFASNSNSTNTATDTTSFAYGPAGNLIPNGAAGTNYARVVKFQTPIQVGDKIFVELDQGSSGLYWTESIYPFIYQSTNTYGVLINPSTATTVQVEFRAGGRISSSTYGANGAPWSDVSGWRWRVRKTSAGAAVSFGQVAENSAGLFPAYNTNLDNATATRLGLKQYLHGTTYNGGNAPTITLASGGGTLSSVPRAIFIPYQCQDGAWRLKFNISALLSSQARSGELLAINGILTRNTTNFVQPVSHSVGAGDIPGTGFMNPSSNVVGSYHANVTTSQVFFSGDVELESKPTWAW